MSVDTPPPAVAQPGESAAPAAAAASPPPAGAPLEEHDRYWLTHVYQGDRVPQLTVRAVLMGGLLGMLMSVSNLYTSLKIGWQFGVAITACVLSWVIWNGARAASGRRLTPMSILENNCMQSTASAAGYSTGTTVATAFGALLLTTGVHMSPWVLAPMVLAIATLGVFIAVPMKRQMIDAERLPFPSGIAAAETLRSLYSHGAEALRKAYALVCALWFGAIVGLMRGPQGAMPWLDRLYGALFRIPDSVPFPAFMNPAPRGQPYGYAFEPSVLLIGAGMIVGLRVSLSMLGSALFLYVVVVPWLQSIDAQAVAAGVAGHIPSLSVDPESGIFNPIRWALWGGTSIMVFSSLTTVAVQWRTIARAFSVLRGQRGGAADIGRLQVPSAWFIAGVVPAGLGLVVLSAFAFDMSIPLGIIAVLMAFVMSLVAARATGETDVTPIGPLGKVSQLLYAGLAPGNITANLMSAGVTSGAATSSADLLTDLKSGYLLGANPRKQFLAQFLGVFFGVLAIVPAWYLLVPDKAALEAFNPPATNMWKAVADALTKGLDFVPVTARFAILAGGLLGVALPLAGKLLPRAARFLPSAMGVGLAWVVPLQNSLSFAIGATIAALWQRASRRSAETYVVPVASGLVAGESLVAALIGIAATIYLKLVP